VSARLAFQVRWRESKFAPFPDAAVRFADARRCGCDINGGGGSTFTRHRIGP
jgi:hypothetical protein